MLHYSLVNADIIHKFHEGYFLVITDFFPPSLLNFIDFRARTFLKEVNNTLHETFDLG